MRNFSNIQFYAPIEIAKYRRNEEKKKKSTTPLVLIV